MYAQRLLPAFAALGLVAAQSSSTCSTTTTIASGADATALASCSVVDGDVIVSADYSDNQLNLGGVTKITGDLTINNATNIATMSSADLEEIDGTFGLTDLTKLSTLTMSKLTKVGSISWTALSALSSFDFTATLSEADRVLITNTFLTRLDGLNLTTVTDLNINNNLRLNSFDANLQTIKGALRFQANGSPFNVSFPELVWAANMTLQNISSLSVPQLSVVNGSLGVVSSFLSELMVPNLTTVGITPNGNDGGLSIQSNAQLTNLSLPMLTKSGGALSVENNTKLQDIDFPSLTDVGGAIRLTGNFTSPDLPDVTNVDGTTTFESGQEYDCPSGTAYRGKITCATKTAGGSTSTATKPGSTSTKKSSADQFRVNGALAGLSVLGGLLQMLL